MDNILLLSDSYKVSHFGQYPPKTTSVYSYFESRGGTYDEVVFFGLQYFLRRYLCGVVVTKEKIDEAEALYEEHFPPGVRFNRDGWTHVLEEHGGRLPLRIRAVPEGTVVPVKNVLMTIENTDPACFWLTNYVETLLVQVWYPMTVATHSREQKKVIAAYLGATGDEASIGFKLHDFGFRGVSSVETAGVGACAHLVNFLGTDTVAGLVVGRDYYGTSCAGFSIPASEHSTITSWGPDGEVAAMRNMLDLYPTGPVACVSDSYDIFRACAEYWGKELREAVLARDGTVVVRPDSGDPATTCLECLRLLGEAIGRTKNEKGYWVLDPHVRVIWGDGIDYKTLIVILKTVTDAGWSADNVGFGSGGGLLQKLHRDTQKCAFKCSAITVDGADRDVWKDPITDPGKASKRGRLALVRAPDGALSTATSCGRGPVDGDVLETIFEDGHMRSEVDLETVRGRAALVGDHPPLSFFEGKAGFPAADAE